jgi:hypothetical protein
LMTVTQPSAAQLGGAERGRAPRGKVSLWISRDMGRRGLWVPGESRRRQGGPPPQQSHRRTV